MFFYRYENPKSLVYFNLSVDEVAIHVHNFLHDLDFSRYKTVNFLVSKNRRGEKYSLAIIFCQNVMTKEQLHKMIDKLPAPEGVNWLGGR